MGAYYLAADLVNGLLGFTFSTTTGGEKKSFLPFKLLDFLEGISMGVGSTIGESSLTGGCKGPPSSAS